MSPRNKLAEARCRSWLAGSLLGLAAGAIAAGCGPVNESASVAAAPAHKPSVPEVVGHFAVQMAKATPLPTVESRRYGGDSLPGLLADEATYTLALPTCTVEVELDKKQQLESVYIWARRHSQGSDTMPALPTPERLVRLGELRRIFGAGQIKPALLTKQEAWRRYPVEFSYLLAPGGREARIRAMMFTPEYSDSAMVHSISLSARE